MYSLIFYVPESHCECVKHAVFAAGAGSLGNYEQCAWQVLGQGQFRPKAGSQPFLGEQDQLTLVNEYRVEMVCASSHLKAAILALKNSHPYEEPAYSVIKFDENCL
ncbi:MAG TPA: NGG1p interacting factor NIF3 [Thiothrix sp.]|nr:NGG1p interacting factor NIF3 [Thiothrix sp.]